MKSSFFYLLLLICSFNVHAQDDVEIMLYPSVEPEEEWSILTNKLYFDVDYKADSTNFNRDTLILLKNRTEPINAILELSKYSTFHFYFNVKDTVLRKTNFETGEAETITVRKQNAIHGKWESQDSLKTVSLVLKNNSKIYYKIVEKKEKLWFIKF